MVNPDLVKLILTKMKLYVDDKKNNFRRFFLKALTRNFQSLSVITSVGKKINL